MSNTIHGIRNDGRKKKHSPHDPCPVFSNGGIATVSDGKLVGGEVFDLLTRAAIVVDALPPMSPHNRDFSRDWLRDYYNLLGKHMVRVRSDYSELAEYWVEPGEVADRIILEEINKPKNINKDTKDTIEEEEF